MSGRVRRRTPVALTAVASGVGGGAFVVGALAGRAEGAAQVGLLSLGVLLTMAGIVIASAQRSRSARALQTAEEAALAAQESLTLTLSGALAPITSYLAELAATPLPESRAMLSGQVRQGVVEAVVALTAPGARSAFYALDADGQALRRAAYAGRATVPREVFLAGTADGDFALGLVLSGSFVLVDDVAAHPLVTPSAPGYRTVVAVAVTAGHRPLGLLTVDAPAPGDLDAVDRDLLRVLANLLASSLAPP